MKTHVTRVLGKLGVRDRVQIVVAASATELVVAGAAFEEVVARGAGQVVRAEAAVEAVAPREREQGNGIRRRCGARPRR